MSAGRFWKKPGAASILPGSSELKAAMNWTGYEVAPVVVSGRR